MSCEQSRAEVVANGGGFPANSGLDEPRTAAVLHLRAGGKKANKKLFKTQKNKRGRRSAATFV